MRSNIFLWLQALFDTNQIKNVICLRIETSARMLTFVFFKRKKLIYDQKLIKNTLIALVAIE